MDLEALKQRNMAQNTVFCTICKRKLPSAAFAPSCIRSGGKTRGRCRACMSLKFYQNKPRRPLQKLTLHQKMIKANSLRLRAIFKRLNLDEKMGRCRTSSRCLQHMAWLEKRGSSTSAYRSCPRRVQRTPQPCGSTSFSS